MRQARPMAIAAFTATVVLTIVAAWAAFVVIPPRWGELSPSDLFFPIIALPFSATGTFIAIRRPGHRVGSLLSLLGISFAIQAVGWLYAEYTLYVEPGGLPGGHYAAWFTNWSWVPSISLLALMCMVFPDGRPHSPRWAPVVKSMPVLAVLGTIGWAFAPGALEEYPDLQNPVALEGPLGWTLGTLQLFFLLSLVGVVLSFLSLLLRYRRADSEQRQQIKWLSVATFPLTVAMVSGFLVWGPFQDTLLLVALISMPIAIAIAILKYRLYDIDVVINRALVYGVVSAALAAAYLGSVALLQLLLPTGGNDLAVAASTLAAAALFAPLRNRVQSAVDTRFYRGRYEAAQVVEEFSLRLRDETDLDELEADLLDVLTHTVQPSHASLWIRRSAEVS